jgi:hypothetical protein
MTIGVDRLFLLGIASVLLTSKFEEIKPIRTQILLEKAGHGKFSHSEILDMERDILQAVGFRIHTSVTLVNEATAIYLIAIGRNCEAQTPSTAAGSPLIVDDHLLHNSGTSSKNFEESVSATTMMDPKKLGEDFCVYLS